MRGDDWDEFDPEGPSEEDLDRFGGDGVTCPNCDRDVYDGLDTCPHCNADLHAKGEARASMATIVAVVLIVVLVGGLVSWVIF